MKTSDQPGWEFREHLPSYLLDLHPGGRAVYLLAMSLVILTLASLPLISIQVSVAGQGIIRPMQERTEIKAAVSGIVDRLYVKEGDRILKSEPLLQIRSPEAKENLHFLYAELKESESHLRDLEGLTAIPLEAPASPRFIRQYEEFTKQTEYLEFLQGKAQREFSRYDELYRDGLISEKDYDDLAFAAEKSRKEVENYKSSVAADWQQACFSQRMQVRDLKRKIRDAEARMSLTTVYSPATGNMIELKGIFEGSVVQAGTVIGILSPDSNLLGEFYVASRNIAFLHKGQPVHIYPDAFPYGEGGVVQACVDEISSDFLLLENQPVYRVKCRLEQNEVTLKNGYSAMLKKGMTFQARCLISRRTLLQLLRDKTGNWLDPARRQDPVPLPL